MTDNTQPEALRLADDLEASSHFPGNMRSCNNAAAAELRRQHASIAELEAARFAYASEFEPNGDGDPDVGSIHANIRAIKAQLASIGAGGVALSAAPAIKPLEWSSENEPAPAPLSDDVVKDAARYRWLREGNDAKHGAAWHVAVNLYGCEWDAAIDAALASQGGKV